MKAAHVGAARGELLEGAQAAHERQLELEARRAGNGVAQRREREIVTRGDAQLGHR